MDMCAHDVALLKSLAALAHGEPMAVLTVGLSPRHTKK